MNFKNALALEIAVDFDFTPKVAAIVLLAPDLQSSGEQGEASKLKATSPLPCSTGHPSALEKMYLTLP